MATAAALPSDNVPWGAAPGDAQVLVNPYGVSGIIAIAYSTSGNVYAYLIVPGGIAQAQPICQTPSGKYPNGGCEAGGPYAAYGYGTW